MDVREAGKRGGLSRSERKLAAVRQNIAKARAARQNAAKPRPQASQETK